MHPSTDDDDDDEDFQCHSVFLGGGGAGGGGRDWRLNGGHTHETGVLLLLRRLLCSALCHLWLGLYLRNYYYDSGT